MTNPTTRKFRAACIVTLPTMNGPMFGGIVHTVITLPGDTAVSIETIQKIERIVKNNKGGTRIPPQATVTLSGLVELEQS